MSALPACLQPRLGFEVFGLVPPGCFGFYVDNDESDPVIRGGETAVIDATSRQLKDGALFLIEWSTGKRDIVQTYRKGYTDARTGFE